MTTHKILISGAGIAGLTMARCLDKLNIEYDIIEQYAASKISSSGIALPFNAIQALRVLGLADEVLAKAHQVKRVDYCKHNGDLLASASLLEAPLDQDKFVALQRSDLHKILASGVEKEIHYETKIKNIVTSKKGVEIESDNPKVMGGYSLLICAEGLESETRKARLENASSVVKHDICNWRFIIELKDHGLEPVYMMRHSELFMAYPLSKDELYCYAHIHDPDNRFENKNHQESIKTLFKCFKGPVPKILEKLDDQSIHFSQLRSVDKAHYYSDHVVYIGDASNACSPLLQQGAACAFEDAIALSESITIALEEGLDFSLDSVGIHYQATRKSKVDWIVANSDDPIKLIKKMKNPIIRFIRNSLIRKKGPLNVQGWRYLASLEKEKQ